MSRLERAIAFRKTVLDKLAEDAGVIAQLRSIVERLKTMTQWAELDLGIGIEVDAEVRYFGRTYRCTAAHIKALTRRPTNTDYWVEVE